MTEKPKTYPTEKPKFLPIVLLEDISDGVHPLFSLYYERKVTMKKG
jgi:hypothetical protein